jgi:arginase
MTDAAYAIIASNEMRRVQLIAVPYDSGRRGERMGAGPERLLDAGLEGRLAGAGHDVQVHVVAASSDGWPAEIRMAFELARSVSIAVRAAIERGGFPLVLSGNCGPAALGCVAGTRARRVFWFDAHGDFNTPETTVGGFLDGMALAALTGRCWRQLAARIPGFEPVDETEVTLIGARDLDPLEAAALKDSAVARLTVGDVRDRRPVFRAGEDVSDTPAYLHFDLDVLDPSEGAINCYAAPGGLSLFEAEGAVRAIGSDTRIAGAAVTALDPAADPSGRSVAAALAICLAIAAAADSAAR